MCCTRHRQQTNCSRRSGPIARRNCTVGTAGSAPSTRQRHPASRDGPRAASAAKCPCYPYCSRLGCSSRHSSRVHCAPATLRPPSPPPSAVQARSPTSQLVLLQSSRRRPTYRRPCATSLVSALAVAGHLPATARRGGVNSNPVGYSQVDKATFRGAVDIDDLRLCTNSM